MPTPFLDEFEALIRSIERRYGRSREAAYQSDPAAYREFLGELGLDQAYEAYDVYVAGEGLAEGWPPEGDMLGLIRDINAWTFGAGPPLPKAANEEVFQIDEKKMSYCWSGISELVLSRADKNKHARLHERVQQGVLVHWKEDLIRAFTPSMKKPKIERFILRLFRQPPTDIPALDDDDVVLSWAETGGYVDVDPCSVDELEALLAADERDRRSSSLDVRYPVNGLEGASPQQKWEAAYRFILSLHGSADWEYPDNSSWCLSMTRNRAEKYLREKAKAEAVSYEEDMAAGLVVYDWPSDPAGERYWVMRIPDAAALKIDGTVMGQCTKDPYQGHQADLDEGRAVFYSLRHEVEGVGKRVYTLRWWKDRNDRDEVARDEVRGINNTVPGFDQAYEPYGDFIDESDEYVLHLFEFMDAAKITPPKETAPAIEAIFANSRRLLATGLRPAAMGRKSAVRMILDYPQQGSGGPHGGRGRLRKNPSRSRQPFRRQPRAFR